MLGTDQRRQALFHQHRVLGRDAENVRELLGHLDQEHVQARQRMPRKALPLLYVDILAWKAVFDLREVRMLLDAGNLGDELLAVLVCAFHVAGFAAFRCLAGTQWRFAHRRLAGAVVAEQPFRVGGLLVNVFQYLAFMDHRQVHRVAAAAEL